MSTPPAVAKFYGVSPETVIDWIRSGQLRAIDVARHGSKRPRFRIDQAALIAFEASRTATPEQKISRRRRERRRE